MRPGNSPNLLAHLREGTADLHAGLESTLPLGSSPLTRQSYATLLIALCGYFRPWETKAMFAAPKHLRSAVSDRARTTMLQVDIGALGCQSPAVDMDPHLLPDLGDEASLLGSMYVLEGSRLGGQIIARRLAATLGLSPDRGLAFFNGFGEQTGVQWERFCALVEDSSAAQAAPDHLLRGARETFLSLQTWMAPAAQAIFG